MVRRLHERGLTTEVEREGSSRWRRVIVEKPFGHDLVTAKALNRDLRSALEERQIYRIDHYLGKETVQNLMVFRFSNSIFEPIWNRRYVDHVQITVAETLGVEGRGGYYEGSGALRDMVPNHIFQLISLVAMEPPISFDADAVRDEQTKVLRAVSPMTPEQVLHNAVRGQYGGGQVGGRTLPGYRTEVNVNPKSNTETFVAMKLDIDNWRWKGVPFYLRVGKALPKRVSEIVVNFRQAAVLAVPEHPHREAGAQPAGHQRAARRGHHADVRGQDPGRGHEHRQGGHALQLRRLLRQGPGHRLRAAAVRRPAGRPDAVPAGGHGGVRLERGGAGAGRLARAVGPRLPQLPGGRLGPAVGPRSAGPRRPHLAPRERERSTALPREPSRRFGPFRLRGEIALRSPRCAEGRLVQACPPFAIQGRNTMSKSTRFYILSAFAAVACLGFASAASAQAPAGGGKPPWMVACEGDVAKFCATEAKANADVRPCLAKKDAELSQSCQDVFLRGYKVLEMCKDDIATHCKDAQGKALGQCFNDNQAKLSDKCKTALRRGSKEHQKEKTAEAPASPETAKAATAEAAPKKATKKKAKKAE